MGIGKAVTPAVRAVFLDRDGVLNRAIVRDGKPYPPASLAELEIVETAAADLTRLKDRGFLLLVATNQPDVSRGTATLEDYSHVPRSHAADLACRRVSRLSA